MGSRALVGFFQDRVFSQCVRDIDAECGYPRLQTIIEHVADHQHAASHPLP